MAYMNESEFPEGVPDKLRYSPEMVEAAYAQGNITDEQRRIALEGLDSRSGIWGSAPGAVLGAALGGALGRMRPGMVMPGAVVGAALGATGGHQLARKDPSGLPGHFYEMTKLDPDTGEVMRRSATIAIEPGMALRALLDPTLNPEARKKIAASLESARAARLEDPLA